MDVKKTGNTTLFMLGIAGMGLSLAMFFDARKSATGLPSKHKCQPKEEEVEEVNEANEEAITAIEDQEEEQQFTPLSPVPEDEPEQPEEELPITPADSPSYKDLYKQEQERKVEEYLKHAPDHSYKGDGSKWSKRMYFIKEAYRRSREATPVDPIIKQRVKYARQEAKQAKEA